MENTKDLIGKKYGRLEVISFSSKKRGVSYWVCKCDCGNEKIVHEWSMLYGKTSSCGCIKREMCKNGTIDLTGERFGRLIVIKQAAQIKNKIILWDCMCDCGNQVVISRANLRSGMTKSCGCIHKEMFSKPDGEAALTQLLNSYKKDARYRNYEFKLEREEFKNLVFSNCHYCGKPPAKQLYIKKTINGSIIYNGIDRVDNTKGYTINNVVPCCTHCNSCKFTSKYNDFKEKMSKQQETAIY